ncbi:MAG: hypothetical protein DRO63_04450 [Candidatus Gerdarchaeota archaeon]|nr:MAG: hypothetical protein DRO63_04450 [Candidatus Gerdarchaeota archaeon]
MVEVVSQIIISQEDSTSFFSMGSIQNDATLVSALGGALSSFAVEIGLADSEATQANFSRFKNGILISKWLTIGEHHPLLMIAVRDFPDLEPYHQMFLLEYGSALAKAILTKFEKVYQSRGAVPRFVEGVKVVPAVAYVLYKSSPNTWKEFAQLIASSCNVFLEELWEKQQDKTLFLKSIQKDTFSPTKISFFLEKFVELFYQEGTRNDAFFPLFFASSPDLTATMKFVLEFLQKKSAQSRKELAEEITRLVTQLQQFSESRHSKKRSSFPLVGFFNSNVLFEQLSVIKRGSFEKTRGKILENLFTTIYLKLFQKYPLKFLAASLTKPLTIDFIRENFNATAQQLLRSSLEKKDAFSQQIVLLLRDLSSQYSPEEVMKNTAEIILEVKEKFLEVFPKKYPFIALVDSNLTQTQKLVSALVREAFEQYRTAHDEAMALWYILRQINEQSQQLPSISFSKCVQLFFLQKLIRKYQFRPVPDIFYTLCKTILANIVKPTKKAQDPVFLLIERQFKSFEKESNIMIPSETSALILRRIKRIKATQKFENIEALSFFSKVFSYALEDTIVKMLEEFFGTIKQPSAPKPLNDSLSKMITYSTALYRTALVFEGLKNQPGFAALLTTDVKKVLTKTLSFETLLPSLTEIALQALLHGFLLLVKTSKSKESQGEFKPEGLTKKQLLALKVVAPELSYQGKLGALLKEPIVINELIFRFLEPTLKQRYRLLLLEKKKFEEQIKKNAMSIKTKKKQLQKLQALKTVCSVYKGFITGGNFFHRLFGRVKPLKQIIQYYSKKSFPGFSLKAYSPTFTQNKKQLTSTFGGYQRIVEVYASTWVRDSAFFDKLHEKLLWDLVKKDVQKGSIEAKILMNLQEEATKGEKTAQTIIIRKTIEDEVFVLFNHAVRTAISRVFAILSDDLFVRYSQRANAFLLPLATISFPAELLAIYFDKTHCCKLTKKGEDKTELNLNLTSLLPLITPRQKQSQTIRNFLYEGLREYMRSNFLKTLDSLAGLVESYIGQQAADLFYTKGRFFEQLILESISQS